MSTTYMPHSKASGAIQDAAACNWTYLDPAALASPSASARRFFRDQYGRELLFHGVNVSGCSKLPSQPVAACLPDQPEFWDERVTFVGRPFPLENAAFHFRRLLHWGLSFCRFLVTWEALEHDGP